MLLLIEPLRAQTSGSNSESDRLQKLERAVEQLQKRNAELEQEVSSLKKQSTSEPGATGKRKTVVTYDGKSYVEKTVAVEEKPRNLRHSARNGIQACARRNIQMNFEDGAVSAFEGRFGETALKDRFRLRRARINLTGDFAENFDFKVEGDFEKSDGIPLQPHRLSGTISPLTTISSQKRTSRLANGKRPSAWSNSLQTRPCSYPSAAYLPGAITPDRQVGAQLWGKPFTNIWPAQKDLLTYHAGIFNGNGRNITINDNNNFMYVGRLELLPLHGKLFDQNSSLKLGGDILNSRDDKGTNISQSLNLLVNSDGSLSPFALPARMKERRGAWTPGSIWVRLI